MGGGREVSDHSFHPLCGGMVHHLLRDYYQRIEVSLTD